MEASKKRFILLALFTLPIAALFAGCADLSTSKPERTAQEQLLISTAADRAMSRMDLRSVRDRRVFIDDTYLKACDASYVAGKFRNAVSFNGALLVDAKAEADIVIELYSGALSMNESVFNFGVPPIELSVLGTGFTTPEIALFKIQTQRSIAKLSAFGYAAIGREMIFSTGTQFGSTTARSYTVLLAGPFTFVNMPPLPREDKEEIFSLVATPGIDDAAEADQAEEAGEALQADEAQDEE